MIKPLYDELLPLLDLPSPPDHRNGRVFSYCPVHGDGLNHGKNPKCRAGMPDYGRSLVLHPTRGLRCFAGCTNTKDGWKLLISVLRREREAPPAPVKERTEPRRSGAFHADSELVATYEYRDEDGELVAVKGRWQWADPTSPKGYDKSFTWRMPDGRWRDGLTIGVTELPLWRIESAVYSRGPVWITEGEEAAKALVEAGEVAVCGGWGASQTTFGQAFRPLAGREIILWPDNDTPGRRYMQAVAWSLRGVAGRVLTVSPECQPKDDAVDYFARGGSLSDVLATAEAAFPVVTDRRTRSWCLQYVRPVSE